MYPVDHPPARRLFRIQPAAREQHFHCNMIRNALGQLDACRIGNGAAANFRQRKTGMIRRQNNVAGQRNFKSATTANTIHSADNRLV